MSTSWGRREAEVDIREQARHSRALPHQLESTLLLARVEESRRWLATWSGIELFAGDFKRLLRYVTVISATDGNHGKSLAAAARSIGCRCVIVLHANVRAEREEAIAAFGAEIVRVEGNYDQSVAAAARLAKANGWHVVSDTSYDGYEEIPRDVMQGYSTIAAEVVDGVTRAARSITHVFLQGGVGGLAAAIVSYFRQVYEDKRPAFVIVEPRQADCLYQSAVHWTAAKASGSVDSVMAGLACGEASPLAWPGAAGVAGLMRLMHDPALSSQAGLSRDSNVLLLNTEGATAPAIYRDLVGEPAESVLARQKVFLDREAGHGPRSSAIAQ